MAEGDRYGRYHFRFIHCSQFNGRGQTAKPLQRWQFIDFFIVAGLFAVLEFRSPFTFTFRLGYNIIKTIFNPLARNEHRG
ncbi:Uncharacterised protein [Chlamydia abortus]|nr:Uncharacterised protein [Chlamydia abortus]